MAGANIERIQVILQAMTAGFTATLDRAKNTLRETRTNLRGFNESLSDNMETFKQVVPYVDQFSNSGAKVGTKLRLAAHGLRGFRMEMLGVMFFGKMLQQTFMEMLKPVMNVYGVFDIWGLMLQSVFMPVMDLLFPLFLGLVDFLMGMPESLKLVVGIFTVLGVVFGTILSVGGALVLGIGAILVALGELGIGVAAAISAFMWFVAVPALLVAAVVIALVLIVAFMYKHWGTITQVVGEAWTKIVNFAKSAKDKIWARLRPLLIKLKTGFKDALDKVKTAFTNLPTKIKTALTNLKNKITATFTNIKNKAKTLGSDIVTKLSAGIDSMKEKIKTAIKNLFPSWARDAIWKTGSFVVDILAKGKETILGALGYKDDFMWRPGGPPIAFSPNDTIIGYKGDLPGGGGSTIVNQTNTFNGFTMDELRRELDDRDRRMVDEIRRLVKA